MNNRNVILKKLRSADGWVSSALLCRDCSISRAAVSKHIKNLRDSGYEIEACTNRGYRFISAPDLLTSNEIMHLCRTNIIGSEFHHFMSLSSTNEHARKLAENNAPDGTLVIAESQTNGHGRKGRHWESPTGSGIYVTLILRPKLPLERTPLLTLAASVAVADAVAQTTGTLPAIKWPNDILLNDGKIAGILTEVSAEIDYVDYVLVGIGINVNTRLELLPERPIFPATSIAAETSSQHSRRRILADLLQNFDQLYLQMQSDDSGTMLKRWKNFSNTIGRRVTITMVNKTLRGTVTDIGDDGALILKTSRGHSQKIFSGDISFN
jgi:BirA family biotin operon repressor/biotin-[acetyl-CoA-carboxylase] ligase